MFRLRHILPALAVCGCLAVACAAAAGCCGPAQVVLPPCPPCPPDLSVPAAPAPVAPPAPAACDRPLPINLPTALRLANVRPIDIALASERVEQAAARLERAQVSWVPTL